MESNEAHPAVPISEPKTADEAQKIIQDVRFRCGILGDEGHAELNKMSPEWRQRFAENTRATREDKARFAKLVATQLYSTGFRFIYELIQNADDSRYLTSAAHTGSPFVEFVIRPGQLIVHSNEDGFNVADVSAICTTAESSKVGNVHTTGEKGLGFKSVFGVANLVTIRSGVWSFEFRYPKGDNGLGMVAPHWKSPDTTCDDGQGTTITLSFVRDDDDFMQELVSAFEAVPDSTLLFLRQLHKIVIRNECGIGSPFERSFQRSTDWNTQTRTIKTREQNISRSLLYWVGREYVKTTPKDNSGDTLSSTSQQSVVELAFPLSPSTRKPYLSLFGQHAFTFLPMKRIAQLPFIIQADFETSAGREDVIDKQRNRQLRDAAATLFANAIENLCSAYIQLRYEWAAFLPSHALADFWEPLGEGIRTALATRRLVAHSSENMLRISELRFIPTCFRYDGEPLLRSQYDLSSKYEEHTVQKLCDWGLKTLSKAEMLAIIREDIEAPTSPRQSVIQHDHPLESGWYTEFYSFLVEELCCHKQHKERLGWLKILPLSSKDGIVWAAPNSISEKQRIYLPRVDDDESAPLMDPELGFRTIALDACTPRERRHFFTQWGISHVDSAMVIEAVLRVNRLARPLNVAHYVRQVVILFWLDWSPGLFNHQALNGVDKRRRVIRMDEAYFLSDEPYSANVLLKGETDQDRSGFLHNLYLQDEVKSHINGKGKTWAGWLESAAGVPTYPKLAESSGPRLNSLFKEIAKKTPSRVVDLLGARWTSSYKFCCQRAPNLVLELGSLEVLCGSGERCPLQDTILPTDKTVTACRNFGLEAEMRLLLIEGKTDPVAVADWSFLELFGVCIKPTISFHLAALSHLMKVPADQSDLPMRVIAVYDGITSIASFADKCELIKFFSSQRAILVRKKWLTSSECLWSGTELTLTKPVLALEYATCAFAQEFFSNLLRIRDATYEDILTELDHIRGRYTDAKFGYLSSRYPTPRDCYQELCKHAATSTLMQQIRTAFRDKLFVYDGKAWHKSSSCVWSSTVRHSGKAVLERLYPSMQEFFVDRLGIKDMNTSMLLQELIHVSGKSSLSLSELKSMLLDAGPMLSCEGPSDTVDDLLKQLRVCRFLPLTAQASSGNLRVSIQDRFFIMDDRQIGQSFLGKLPLLDFTFSEVALMHPLFTALRLETRYLSRCVKTETSVQNATFHQVLTNNMRKRSLAICRCVAMYDSITDQSGLEMKHRQLLHCRVLVSDHISTVMTVDEVTIGMNENSNSVPMKIEFGPSSHRVNTEQRAIQGKELWRGDERADESYGDKQSNDPHDNDPTREERTEDRTPETILTVVLPRNDALRGRCLRAYFPGHMMKVFGISAQAAERQFYRILNEPLPTLVNVLSEEGVPEVPSLRRYQLESIRAAGEEVLGDKLGVAEGHWGAVQGAGIDAVEVLAASDFRSLSLSDSRPNISAPASFDPGRYHRVLEHVLAQARAIEGTTDGYQIASAGPPLPCREDLGILPDQDLTHAIWQRIGAAGELFALERLRALGVVDLGHENWRSTIRHLVQGVRGYDAPEPYEHAEVADIMYEDHHGIMTRLLRRKAFASFATWQESVDEDEPVEYYLEVKTTIRGCNERFHITEHQLGLSSRHTLVVGKRPKVVYVVVRVYDLLSHNIGIEFFVDPKALERDGILRFAFGDITVTPQT